MRITCRLIDGRVTADNLDRYKIMKSNETPQCDIILFEDPEPTEPNGAISPGDPPAITTAPAIINAIYDAVGVRITSLPATREKILAGLKARDQSV